MSQPEPGNAKRRLSLPEHDAPSKRKKEIALPSRHKHKREVTLPSPREWYKVQTAVVTNRTIYKRIVGALTDVKRDRSVQAEVKNELLKVGLDLALLTKNIPRDLTRVREFAVFQCISYCVYLERKGFSYRDVHTVLQAFLKFDENKRNRLLKRVGIVNAVIAEIARLERWNVFRATEWLLIYQITINTLIGTLEKDLREIPSRLSKDKHDFSDCLKPSYTIPGLIKHHLDQAGLQEVDTVETIANLLDYGTTPIPRSIRDIHEIHAANETPPIQFVTTSFEKSSQSEVGAVFQARKKDHSHCKSQSRALDSSVARSLTPDLKAQGIDIAKKDTQSATLLSIYVDAEVLRKDDEIVPCKQQTAERSDTNSKLPTMNPSPVVPSDARDAMAPGQSSAYGQGLSETRLKAAERKGNVDQDMQYQDGPAQTFGMDTPQPSDAIPARKRPKRGREDECALVRTLSNDAAAENEKNLRASAGTLQYSQLKASTQQSNREVPSISAIIGQLSSHGVFEGLRNLRTDVPHMQQMSLSHFSTTNKTIQRFLTRSSVYVHDTQAHQVICMLRKVPN
ncbi:hypothetical protein HBI51_251440 [Parastagonospora nodorum]|nr:hypothetical protein HBI51_251440 [Parastagonospora nodorum]KAH5982989.1 hypothetical protein HBI84_249520 [Parastagonospora nodorum]KAH6380440.1 hypothetical protein HBI08_239950 [Parastagonospora nodorum]